MPCPPAVRDGAGTGCEWIPDGLLLEVGGIHQQRPAGSGTMMLVDDVVWTKRPLEARLE